MPGGRQTAAGELLQLGKRERYMTGPGTHE
jgi:hypothetical protein